MITIKKPGHPNMNSVRISCFRNENNLFYVVDIIRFKTVLPF